MKKLLSWMIIFVLMFTIGCSVYAEDGSKARNITPSLTFNGTTAICSGSITDSGSFVTITLHLYEGTTRLGSWSDYGVSVASVLGYANVQHGHTYLLAGSATAGGVPVTVIPVSATCP